MNSKVEAEGKAERCSFPQEEDKEKLSTNLREAQAQIATAYQNMVNEMKLGEIADRIGDQFSDAIWDLKADIFMALQKAKVVAEDAEGPDNEELIKDVLDELWRRA